MSNVAGGNGRAFDASAETRDDAAEVPTRTPAQQKYLDHVAEAAERSIEHTEQMIKDLQESLEDRKAEAERARTEAENGRAE